MSDAARVAGAFLNSWLRLIVMPTEKCNYRCVYCYEDFAYGKMTTVVSDRLLKLILNKIPHISDLEISWFGGEPLLAVGVMEKIMSSAIVECASHHVNIRSGAATNGHLLTPRTFQKLIDLNVNHFQITLDGPKSFHDDRRRQRSGPGAFDFIANNLSSMCSTDRNFTVNLRVHLDRTNASHLGALFDELGSVATDPRVSFSLERLKNLGKSLPDSIAPMSQDELDSVAQHCEATLSGTGIKIQKFKRETEPVCYAALPNNYVVRSDGRIQKCTVTLEDDRNTVGTLDDSGAIEVNEKYGKWLSGWATGDSSFLRCPAVHVCHHER